MAGVYIEKVYCCTIINSNLWFAGTFVVLGTVKGVHLVAWDTFIWERGVSRGTSKLLRCDRTVELMGASQ